MNIKHVLKTTFISFLALLATLQTNAQDSLYTKFDRKINDAYRFDNPDWVRDISEATNIAMEIAKTQNNYREIVEVGNFLLKVKDYKNALTFLEFAAINKEMLAWCDIARMHFLGIGVPQNIKKAMKFSIKGSNIAPILYGLRMGCFSKRWKVFTNRLSNMRSNAYPIRKAYLKTLKTVATLLM